MRVISTILLLSAFASAAPPTSSVTGSVRNGTSGQPAVGDEVFLLRLDHEMAEEAHTRTDAQGKFRFPLDNPAQGHFVRVIHQNVSYDQPTSPGQAPSIQVFDTAQSVPGVSGSIEILRAGTRGQQLHVSDMFEITNQSNPPMTEIGEHTFEVRLPENSKLNSVLAAAPGRAGVAISAAPIAGAPGHYWVNFPLRPGATKLAINYDLPYNGRITFPTWHSFPTELFAIMIPPSMTFSSPSEIFRILPTKQSSYQVHAATQVKAGKGPQFQLTGFGDIPPLRDTVKAQSPSRMMTVPQVVAPSPASQDHLASAQINPQRGTAHLRLGSSVILAAGAGTILALCLLVFRRSRNLRVFSRVNNQRA